MRRVYAKNNRRRQAATSVGAFLLALLTCVGAPDLLRAQDETDDEELKAQDQEFSAHGFNTLRIEQEDKISVPPDKADEVWNFLHEIFIADTTALKKLDPRFTAYYNDEHFADTYFDTPALQLYAMRSGVRHRQRENLTDADDRKSGRELMQIKVNDISANALERGEFKFAIHYPTQIKVPEDRHPMLGIVKPSQREEFKTRLRALGLDPAAMRPIFTAYDHRKRIYLQRDKKTLLSVSFDHVTAEMLWKKADYIEIESELNEIAFTEADSATRKYMEATNAKISDMIKEKFPFSKTDLTPKYNKSFNQLEAQIPFLRFLIQAGLDNKTNIVFAALGTALAVIGGGFWAGKKIFSGKSKSLVSSAAQP